MKTSPLALLLLALLTTSGFAVDPPETGKAANDSDRPLAPSPFNEKAVLAALSGVEGKVERYKLRLNKGWLDRNRLSVIITAEVVDNRGQRKSLSRNAIVTFRDGQKSLLTLE